jgi:dTDP-glucose 4,6-dehydratase/UDP-glucose 4-epimerase
LKVLILGSTGFIGSHLVNHFCENKNIVFGCDLVELDSRDYNYSKLSVLSSDFEQLFINHSFDVCINASGSGNVGYSIENPLSDFEANSLSVFKILDCIKKHQPSCKYLHISSAAVYGNPLRLPIIETDELSPLSPYGFHKLISETICKEFHQLFGIRTAIIRPFSVYGNGLKKQLLWDICKKLDTNNDIELYGTGRESRDFIHVNDLVHIVDLIIASATFENDVFNVANGEETNIQYLATIFKQYFKGKEISFSGKTKNGDPLNWKADISKIIRLGYCPKVTLEEGVINYITWYKQSKNAR